jgi:hypothetical protein
MNEQLNTYIDTLYKEVDKLKRFPSKREFVHSQNIAGSTFSERLKKIDNLLTYSVLCDKVREKYLETKYYARKIGSQISKPKEIRKQEIIDKYADYCEKQGKIVGASIFLRSNGHGTINSCFFSSNELIDAAKKKHPRKFENLIGYYDKDKKQKAFLKKYAELSKKYGYEISQQECRLHNFYTENYGDGKIENIRKDARELFPDIMKNVKNREEKMIEEYVDSYLKKVKRYKNLYKGLLPNWIFLTYYNKCPITQEELREKTIEKYPEEFKDDAKLKIEKTFTKNRFIELQGKLKEYKKFFITTYVAGQPVNMEFLESIRKYCKEENSALLLMVCNKKYEEIDDEFLGENIIFTPELYDPQQIINQEIKLNSNFCLSTIAIPAKQIRTLTGLERFCVKNASTIVAAPKQFMKCVPVQKTKPARVIMSTGAITNPYYNSERYYQKRTDYIAHEDHQIGGIIVEIENDTIFHFRQVTANREDGSFYDLSKKYTKTGVIASFPEAFVMGDLHSRRKDENVFKTWIDCIETLKPKTIVLHDVFEAISISHHNEDKNITKAIYAKEGLLDLENEIKVLVNDLNLLASKAKEIVIVKSNHDEHLDRYLNEGRYIKEPYNYKFANLLASAMLDKKDALKYACEISGLKASNIRWLERKEDYYVAETQLGCHGDLGANGGKGGISSIENAFPNAVTAHSHTPCVWRSVYVVGTTSKMDMGYNVGLSSWMNTSCIVHRTGARQLINCINNSWRAKDKPKRKK